jgi:hypothetical protein
MNTKLKIILAILTMAAVTIVIVLLLVKVKTPAEEPLALEPLTPQTIQSCFRNEHTATPTEPYATTEDVTLNITDQTVFGVKRGTQSGPDMTNGYQGVLTGTKDGSQLSLRFDYVIEGSEQTEMEEYEISDATLTKLRWPLREENKILVPDKTGQMKRISYTSVPCPNISKE